MCTLNDLDVGQTAVIKKNRIQGNLGKRFHELGFTKGTSLKLEKKAPLGYPLNIKIRGFSLALRKEEALAIELE